MKAVIMAGGRGTRLRPLTCYLPKPMVPLLDRPCMEYIVDLLVAHGIPDIAVTVQYMPQVIRTHFGDGTEFGVSMRIYEEAQPLGTAGSVKNVEPWLDDTFIVISGDAMTDFNLAEIIRFHKRKGALATLVLTRVETPLEYGVVMVAEDGRIERFLEKPSWSEVFSDTVNTGIYVFEPEVLELIPQDVEWDFSKDLFPLLLERGLPLYGYVADGYWSDIGNLEQYRQTQFDMLMGLVDVHIVGEERAPRVWVGEDVQIAADATLRGPSFIGAGCTIGAGAEIGPYAVVGRGCQLGAGCTMERAVMWRGNRVGANAHLTGCALCGNLQLGRGVDVCEGAIIGDKVRVGDLAVIRPDVKIWPEKQIGEGVIQQTSLIWGKTVFHSLFDEDGISGLANIELIPEMVSRIAASYAASLKTGATVCVSCDEYPYCGILKFSVISSLLAAGVQVRDIGVAPVPVARYEIRRSSSSGGVHIRSLDEDGDARIVLQFFDQDGLPIDRGAERKIENAFFQEDFSRPSVHNIGHLEEGQQALDLYVYEVLSHVRVDLVRNRRFKVVFHCASQPVLQVMLKLLEQLGCEVVTVYRGDPDMASLVLQNRADLGIALDGSGQSFAFFSETGTRLTDDQVAIVQMLIAVKEQAPVAIPVTAPSVMEEMSEQVGIPVVRTKTVLRSLLEVGRERPVQVHYDGFYSVVSLMQFLVEEGLALQSVIDQFPSFHMVTELVSCPVRAKGRVMRRLMEDLKGQPLQLIDGIKVLTDEGWALVLPDAERPQFKIVAQAGSKDAVHRLVTTYRDKIQSFQLA